MMASELNEAGGTVSGHERSRREIASVTSTDAFSIHPTFNQRLTILPAHPSAQTPAISDPNPTSPAVAVSSYAATRGWSKFPLHFDLVYFFGEGQPEFIEQDLLVV